MSLQLILLLHSFFPPSYTLFSRTTWVSRYQKGKKCGFKWGKRWWSSGMQWHQLDHMQIICTSLQTRQPFQHPSLNFYRQDALPDKMSLQDVQNYLICRNYFKWAILNTGVPQTWSKQDFLIIPDCSPTFGQLPDNGQLPDISRYYR